MDHPHITMPCASSEPDSPHANAASVRASTCGRVRSWPPAPEVTGRAERLLPSEGTWRTQVRDGRAMMRQRWGWAEWLPPSEESGRANRRGGGVEPGQRWHLRSLSPSPGVPGSQPLPTALPSPGFTTHNAAQSRMDLVTSTTVTSPAGPDAAALACASVVAHAASVAHGCSALLPPHEPSQGNIVITKLQDLYYPLGCRLAEPKGRMPSIAAQVL
ncbi:hypothetical protein U9M48_040347 [Paspalum notatum var. saurae]|uniref:Uncharacterized protein n=1 Tax=Paspalum notatum var. saurae TaxID=547442 RepID=A0AAQ3UMN7_PASNO